MRALLLSTIFTTLFLTACKPPLNDDPPQNYNNFSSSAPSRWSINRFPMTVKISDEFTDSETESLKSMGLVWETATASSYDFFDLSQKTSKQGNGSLDNFNDAELGIYKSYDWVSELPNTALAVTQLFGMRRNIGTANEYIELTHADIIFNYKSYVFTVSGIPGTYDLPTVALHEMGHFLGLYHNNNYFYEDTVMQPSLSSSTELREVFAADIREIKKLYPWSGESDSESQQAARPRSGEFVISGQAGDSKLPTEPTRPDEPVQIIMELYPDGKCLHKSEHKIIEAHKIEL